MRLPKLLLSACVLSIFVFFAHRQSESMRLKQEKLSADAERFHRTFLERNAGNSILFTAGPPHNESGSQPALSEVNVEGKPR